MKNKRRWQSLPYGLWSVLLGVTGIVLFIIDLLVREKIIQTGPFIKAAKFIEGNWQWLVFMIIAMIFLWRRSKRPRPLYHEIVLFLPHEEEQKHFWKDFAEKCSIELDKRGYHCRSKWPEEGYKEDDICSVIENEINWENVDGAIISGANTEKIINSVIKQLKKGRKLILHDIAVNEKLLNKFSMSRVKRPPLVTVNNRYGGQLAAEIMKSYFIDESSTLDLFNCLIVPGHKIHKHSEERVIGFEGKSQDYRQGGIEMRIENHTEPGNWKEKGAWDAISRYIKSNRNSFESCKLHIHGIFACNDEMALAVDKFISEEIVNFETKSQVKEKFNHMVIVGFDATDNMMNAINRKGRIIGTIDAKIGEQAVVAAKLIDKVIKGQKRIKDEIIKPKKFYIGEIEK